MGARGSFKGLDQIRGLGDGVVSAWLRLASGTVTGLGYSSVPDILANPDNPATQSTDANRPPNLTGANGPRADFTGDDFLSWAVASNNNQTAAWGFASWFEPDDTAAAVRGIISALPGATNRVEIIQFGTSLLVDVYHSQFVARRGTVASVFAAATKVFLTVEFLGAGADDAAKLVVTANAVVQSVTPSDTSGTPGAFPTAMVVTAGPYFIGARGPAGAAQRLDGKLGPNIYLLGAKMADATTGLLTSAARSTLMNLEPA